MTLVTEIRKNVTEVTPLMAVVGATDYAAERVRTVAANASHLPEGWQARVRSMDLTLDVKAVQQAPVVVLHRVLELAGQVEESYGRLAERGKELVDRARETAPVQEFVRQGRITVSRTRAAVTSARRTLDDGTAAALGVISLGRREAREAAAAVEAGVAGSVAATEKVVEERARVTRVGVRGAAVTVRNRAAATRSAAKGAATSARKTAVKAVDAVEAVVAEVGDGTPDQPAS